MVKGYNISFGYFLEDRFHENFIRPLVTRVSAETTLPKKFCSHKIEYARGGGSVEAFVRFVGDYKNGKKPPYSVAVIAIDADKNGSQIRSKAIRRIVTSKNYEWPVVVAIPEPCIERWLLFEYHVWSEIVGSSLGNPPRRNQDCNYYKRTVELILDKLPTPAYFDAWQFGPDIVRELDIENIKMNNRDFRIFVNDLRNVVAAYSTSIEKS